jgi:hypothetical protein
MADEPQRLAERMRSEGEKSLAYFRGLDEAAWPVQIYTEGTCWSVRQVLAHFVASEYSFHLLLKNILKGGEGSPEGFDIDVYNEEWVARLADKSAGELLEAFAARRRESALLVESLAPQDLEQRGRHPFLGVAPLEDIIKLIYRHNGIHIRDIRRALEEKMKDPGAAISGGESRATPA